MTESYAKIEVTIHLVKRDAVQISPTGRGSFPVTVWVPRSLVHGGDDLKLAKALRNDTLTIRIMEWKAKDLGLLPSSTPRQSELKL